MKDYDNTLVTQISAEEAITFFLVDLEISDTVTKYYTTLDIDIVYDSNRYESTEFEIDPIKYALGMAVDKMVMRFANVDLAMSAILLNNTIVKRPCIVYQGAMDGMTPIAEEVFRGVVSLWNFDEKTAAITISNEFVFWKKKTLRQPGALCSWVFKGTECGYTGAETVCNKSYDRCFALGMSDNFGGFRFLPSMEEKTVPWGRQS